jgi:hypothetical protein
MMSIASDGLPSQSEVVKVAVGFSPRTDLREDESRSDV